MPCDYIPLVRTFCRLRAQMVRHLGVERHEVRPDTPLHDLIPAERRREFWQQLRQEGLSPPDLSLSPKDGCMAALMAVKTAASFALSLQSWYGLLTIFPVTVLLYRTTRHRAVHLASCYRTVGELVLGLTPVAGHPGYRWGRKEIALKVRLVVAEASGLTLDEVEESTPFTDVFG